MSNWIRIELDEETGDVTARAFAAAEYGPKGRERSVTVGIDLTGPDPALSTERREAIGAPTQTVKAALGKLLEAVRPDLEREVRKARASAEHVAETRLEFDPDAAEARKARAAKSHK